MQRLCDGMDQYQGHGGMVVCVSGAARMGRVMAALAKCTSLVYLNLGCMIHSCGIDHVH